MLGCYTLTPAEWACADKRNMMQAACIVFREQEQRRPEHSSMILQWSKSGHRRQDEARDTATGAGPSRQAAEPETTGGNRETALTKPVIISARDMAQFQEGPTWIHKPQAYCQGHLLYRGQPVITISNLV